EHDEVDLAHQTGACDGVLALSGCDALDLDARDIADAAPDLEPRGAGLTIDEDRRLGPAFELAFGSGLRGGMWCGACWRSAAAGHWGHSGNCEQKRRAQGAAGARDKRWQRPSSQPRTRRAAASRRKGQLCSLPRHGRSYAVTMAKLSIGVARSSRRFTLVCCNSLPAPEAVSPSHSST